MLPDRVSNPGPLTYESGALPIALRGPARMIQKFELVSLNILHAVSFCSISATCGNLFTGFQR